MSEDFPAFCTLKEITYFFEPVLHLYQVFDNFKTLLTLLSFMKTANHKDSLFWSAIHCFALIIKCRYYST